MGPGLEGKGRKRAEHQLYQTPVFFSRDKARTSVPAEGSQMSDSKDSVGRNGGKFLGLPRIDSYCGATSACRNSLTAVKPARIPK